MNSYGRCKSDSQNWAVREKAPLLFGRMSRLLDDGSAANARVGEDVELIATTCRELSDNGAFLTGLEPVQGIGLCL